jgi:hypothetical protein
MKNKSSSFFWRFYRTDYMIAYRKSNKSLGVLEEDQNKFIPFKNTLKYWYADPILYKHNNELYMFYEAYNKKRNLGEIGVAKVINNEIVEKKIIMKESFHMSYPFVFNIKNKQYMIPETSSVKKLLLYEAVKFPYEWKLSRVLLEDIELSDATILKHNKKLYLFASKILCPSPYRDQLLIYTMESDFELVPFERNPVITDNSVSRPAGRILNYDNKLIRISQDCSNGEYGKAIKFNEIRELSNDEYSEKTFFTILPGDIPITYRKKLTGTHSYGKCDDFEVIDVRYSVFDLKKFLIFLYQLPFKLVFKSLKIIKNN